MSNVRCNYCGGTYNLQDVEVIHRYEDCTQFKTPCCGKTADDRTWVSLPAFTRQDVHKKYRRFALDINGKDPYNG